MLLIRAIVGQEITTSTFTPEDFRQFADHLHREQIALVQWFDQKVFVEQGSIGGFELEAWLMDAQCEPAPINQQFLAKLAHPLVVAELACFNVELNTQPQELSGRALQRMTEELNQTWSLCTQTAEQLNATMVMTGILPTVTQDQLTVAHMSPLERYRALNEQTQHLRQERPIHLQIEGLDSLDILHHDLIIESAATSFQVHLQVKPQEAVRFYNAAQVISAPIMAITANSPYLFGHDLWDETRIPLFEQSVAGCVPDRDTGLQRVTFGTGYVQNSLLECFIENNQYPVLLPVCDETGQSTLAHLRLHNGTIWRWNRPLIGFEADGTPHLRLEHRVIPAGPTVLDCVANAALFYGLVQMFADQEQPKLPFALAKANFYTCARQGLGARVIWEDGQELSVHALLTDTLLPLAHQGLVRLGLDPEDIRFYLGILEGRLRNKQNGANWQRAFVARHQATMQELTRAYVTHQQSGVPVHEWEL